MLTCKCTCINESRKWRGSARSPHQTELRDLSARFTKSPTAADLDLSLCPRCRAIDLDGVVEAAGAGEDLDSAIVARVAFAASFTDPTCRFCVFLSHGGLRSRFSWQGQSQPWKLCLFDSLRARGFPKTDDGTLETRSIVMALFPEGHTYVSPEEPMILLRSSYSQAEIQQPSRFTYCARQVHASHINYGLIKEWLRDCESGHEICRLQRPMMKPTQVIDCLQQKVVSCTPHTEYLALSYVWGKQPQVDKESLPHPLNGKLPDQIPKAILDAMTLVVALGYQYLWVDRFCIDQNNALEKHHQISHMAEVYEGALVTIVAASSTAADDGIPGVSIPRVMTPCVRISARLSLQACLHSVHQSLIASEWNKRGWTYQEFCLSRRCLIFADDQVHFICRRGTTCEGIKEGALGNLPVASWRCLGPRILEHGAGTRDTPPFLRHLYAYTRRMFSYDSDKLNAFRGILSRSQIASYWGVPVCNTDLTLGSAPASVEVSPLAPFHLGFSKGLCWSRSDKFSGALGTSEYNTGKPNGLPSWSWVSCPGRIWYPYGRDVDLNKKDEFWISKDFVKCFAEVFLDDPSSNNQERLTAMIRPSRNPSRMIPEGSSFIYIRSVVKTRESEKDVWTYEMLWDCEDTMLRRPETPLLFILLLVTLDDRTETHQFYMVVTMERGVARRVGILITSSKAADSQLRDLGVKTIKVA
jgi:hypothetical protein